MDDDDVVELGIEDLTDAVEVGAGGFGTVYKARQESLRRDVAVKMVANTVKDRKVRIRFEREIQAMGMLSGHPNIVTVYDSGFTAGGQPYILMDFMERGSLGDRLEEEGALPWPDVLQIMVQVCGALETAHQAGILHRDLKPENVLVSGYGEPKLGDFGIARLKGGPETGTASLTASIEHVAPELLEAQPPGVGSDLYALGSTMFKLLTGEAAFVRKGDESIVPALTRIKDEPVPDLRQRGIPDAVARVVERAMAKDPAQRFASAAEMGRALQQTQQALGQLPTSLPIREEEAARARESTRTLNSDDIAQSIEDIRASQGFAGSTGGVPGPVTGPVTGPGPIPPTGPTPYAGQTGPQYAPPQQPQPQYAGYGGAPPKTSAPWGIIAAVVGVVVVLGGIGGAIALSGGDDPTEEPTPPPDEETTPPEEPTDPPTTEPDDGPTTEPGPEPYAAFEPVFDDSNSITVTVPRPWADVDRGPWVIDGQEVGQQITAAPDLDAFRSTWTTPGLIFGASEQLATSFTPETLADAISFSDQCTYEGREIYTDPAYTGVRDEYTDCGGTGTSYTIIAGQPPAGGRLVLLQFQAVDDRDDEALEQAINTFFHTGDGGGGAGAAPPTEGG